MFIIALPLMFLNLTIQSGEVKPVKPSKKADNFIKMGLQSQDLIFGSLDNPKLAMSHMASSIYFNVQAMKNGKEKAPSYIIDPANNPDVLNLFKTHKMRKELYEIIHKKQEKRQTLSKKNCTDLADLVRYNGKLIEALDNISQARDKKSLNQYTKCYIKTFTKLQSIDNSELLDHKYKLLSDAHNAFQGKEIDLFLFKRTKKMLSTLNQEYILGLEACKNPTSATATIHRLFNNSIDLMLNDTPETKQSGYKNFYNAMNLVIALPKANRYRETLVESAFRKLNPKLESGQLLLPNEVSLRIGFLVNKFANPEQ